MEYSVIYTQDTYYEDLRKKLVAYIFEKPKNNLEDEKKHIELFNKFNDIVIPEDQMKDIYNLKKNPPKLNILNFQISCFAYWYIFKKRFLDLYFLILQKHYVLYYKEKFESILEYTFIPSTDQGKDLINEDPKVKRRRDEILKSIEAFEKAESELTKILLV